MNKSRKIKTPMDDHELNRNILDVKNNSDFENLFEIGIKKLKNFGFMNVTKENILSDDVYSFFFMRFMESLPGENPDLDKQIETLLNSLKNKKH